VIVTRTGWTGEVGFEIYLRDGSRGSDLWERIMAAGLPFDIRPTGPSDIRRVEAGILNHGADMTLQNNPYEAGLERLVDLDKSQDFMGRDALRRIREAGVSRKLVGVEIAGDRLPFNDQKWTVRDGDRPIGHVSSALYSPRLEKNIGYAWVPTDRSQLGTKFVVEAPFGEAPALVVSVPFVDPTKVIPKS